MNALTLRKVLIPMLLLLLVAVGSGVFWTMTMNSSEAQKDLYKGTISIGYVPWPGYIAFHVAEKKGFFAAEGINVDFRPYLSLSEATHDYKTGTLLGKASVTPEVLQEVLQGVDQQVVLAIDYSSGADGIIGKNTFTSLSDTKGMKVGFEFGTMEEFLLLYALDLQKMTLDDIEKVDLSPSAAATAFSMGEVDVAVTYEPFMTSAMLTGSGKLLYSTSEASGIITDTLSFKRRFIEEEPATIEALLRAYFRAVEYVKTDPEESYAIMAEVYNVSPEEIAEQMKGVTLLNALDNRRAFTESSSLTSLHGNLRHIETLLRAHHNSSYQTTDINALINDAFLKKVLQ